MARNQTRLHRKKFYRLLRTCIKTQSNLSIYIAPLSIDAQIKASIDGRFQLNRNSKPPKKQQKCMFNSHKCLVTGHCVSVCAVRLEDSGWLLTSHLATFLQRTIAQHPNFLVRTPAADCSLFNRGPNRKWTVSRGDNL